MGKQSNNSGGQILIVEGSNRLNREIWVEEAQNSGQEISVIGNATIAKRWGISIASFREDIQSFKNYQLKGKESTSEVNMLEKEEKIIFLSTTESDVKGD